MDKDQPGEWYDIKDDGTILRMKSVDISKLIEGSSFLVRRQLVRTPLYSDLPFPYVATVFLCCHGQFEARAFGGPLDGQFFRCTGFADAHRRHLGMVRLARDMIKKAMEKEPT